MTPELVEGPISAPRRRPRPRSRPLAHAGGRPETLRTVDHVVGYGPYVDRVPDRPGLTKHASGNTVELDRARFALDLALAGERVAVVSGGDAGVFGMAAAVFEAAEDPAYAPVRIEVRPGLTAAQAVAARAGAPLGGDYAVLSLSDRLKPWAVIEDRLRAVAAADLVLAVYNPASRTRTSPGQAGQGDPAGVSRGGDARWSSAATSVATASRWSSPPSATSTPTPST